MQLNKNQIAQISMKDLFFHLIYRWRSILLAALIGALVLCGYQYLSVKKAHDAGKQTKEERQYQIDVQEYGEQLASSRNTIKVFSKLLQDQNNYLNESSYIQLSPQNVWVSSSKYLVKPDQSVMDALPQGSSIDPADSILPAYAAPLSEINDEEELKEAFGTDNTEYVSELVVTNTNTDENTVTVYVLGETKEAAQAGAALIQKQMESLAEGKANQIAKHQLILVSESISRGIDKVLSEKIDLAQKQETLSKTLEENQETLQDARQKLDRLEASGEPGAPGMHLTKMGVIGFVVGAAIMILLYTVLYVLSDKLNHSRNLTDRYRIPIYGEFASSGCLHQCKGLDKLFSKWERGKNALKDETVYDNIAALISEKNAGKSVLLVSTLPEEKLGAVKENLVKRMPEEKIEIQAEAIKDSGTISKATKADAVIFTEKKRVSSIKEMDRLAETLIIADANVIGAIIL